MHIFLSHNHRDKHDARRLGIELQLAGADVWFDEWNVQVGESIPGAVNDALERVDTVAVLWSEAASASNWVRAELEAALARALSEGEVRLIPVILDDHELPPLLAMRRWVDLRDGGFATAVRQLAGLESEAARIRAMQAVFDDLQIEVRYFHGYGAAVGCPRCGAGVGDLEQWHQTDYARDDEYAGARCTTCGWEGGGEVW
jgi:uncharacterized protein (DUF2267 family)